MEKVKWENNFKTCIGYVSLREMREEYFLNWEEWQKLSVANKGDVIVVGDEKIECVGSVEELLDEIERLRKAKELVSARFTKKVRENLFLTDKVRKLLNLIRPILGVLELDGLDVVDVETGDILTK